MHQKIIVNIQKVNFRLEEKNYVPRVRIELTTFRFLAYIMRLTRCLLR